MLTFGSFCAGVRSAGCLRSLRGDRPLLPYALAWNAPAVPGDRPRPARGGMDGGPQQGVGGAAAGSRQDPHRPGGRAAAGPQDRRPRAEHRDPEPVDRALAELRPATATAAADRSLDADVTVLTYQSLAVFDPDAETDEEGRTRSPLRPAARQRPGADRPAGRRRAAHARPRRVPPPARRLGPAGRRGPRPAAGRDRARADRDPAGVAVTRRGRAGRHAVRHPDPRRLDPGARP